MDAGQAGARTITLVACALTMSGCLQNLSRSAADERRAQRSLAVISGVVSSDDGQTGPIVVAALRARRDAPMRVGNYVILDDDGRYEIGVSAGIYRVAAFRDLDGDREYDPREPAGVYHDWETVPVVGRAVDGIDLTVRASLEATPEVDASRPESVRLGEVVSLDDERFGVAAGNVALWEPYRFITEYGAGTFFLEPHDPARIPVLFVHGMGGYPQEFQALIAALDETRYQAWVAQYPSGWGLEQVAVYIHRELDRAAATYALDDLCIVAHSMGGLVVRAALGHYARQRSRRRDYVRSFITIASPLAGHPGAATGVSMSPVVVPAWRDLSPRSDFVRWLYDAPLPESVAYELVFTFDNGEGDGVVPLRSQLRPEAQAEARSERGFPFGHAEILQEEESVAYVLALLEGSCARRRPATRPEGGRAAVRKNAGDRPSGVRRRPGSRRSPRTRSPVGSDWRRAPPRAR